MDFIVGTGTQLQMGKEKTYGVKTTMTDLVNLTSESLKVSVEKGDEGSLLASKTAQSRDLMAVNVDGSISFILRPEFAGLLFHTAMGGADAVDNGVEGYFTHTFNLCDVNEVLPSLTFTIDRKTAVKAYPGCTISTLNIDAAAGDYVKGSIDIKGHTEEEGQLGVVPAFTVPSYRCTNANFTFGGKKYCISSASFKIDNALEEAPKTYCTGLYKGQPQHGMRSVTIDFEIPYSKEVEALKEANLVTEQLGAAVLTFTSRDENTKITITMPNVSINDVSANVGGTGLVNASVAGEALSVGGAEPVTVVIQDQHADAYGVDEV